MNWSALNWTWNRIVNLLRPIEKKYWSSPLAVNAVPSVATQTLYHLPHQLNRWKWKRNFEKKKDTKTQKVPKKWDNILFNTPMLTEEFSGQSRDYAAKYPPLEFHLDSQSDTRFMQIVWKQSYDPFLRNFHFFLDSFLLSFSSSVVLTKWNKKSCDETTWFIMIWKWKVNHTIRSAIGFRYTLKI